MQNEGVGVAFPNALCKNDTARYALFLTLGKERFLLINIGRYEMNEVKQSENRIAVISILVADRNVSGEINALLSAYGDWIIGRMGIPYKEKKVSILSIVMDASVEVVNTLTGKIGKMKGVSVKALFGKM